MSLDLFGQILDEFFYIYFPEVEKLHNYLFETVYLFLTRDCIDRKLRK